MTDDEPFGTAAYNSRETALAFAHVRRLAYAVGAGELSPDIARDAVIRLASTTCAFAGGFPVSTRLGETAADAIRRGFVGHMNLMLHIFEQHLHDASWRADVAEMQLRRHAVPMLDNCRPRAAIEAAASRVAGEHLCAAAVAAILEQEVVWWGMRRRRAARRP